MFQRSYLAVSVTLLATVGVVSAQEPVEWGTDLYFSTFSIAAIDRETGESGVAVTTRVPCVGNGVPWVRAGVGAVATQASTRVAYGNELLDFIAEGMSANEALSRAVAADSGSAPAAGGRHLLGRLTSSAYRGRDQRLGGTSRRSQLRDSGQHLGGPGGGGRGRPQLRGHRG